MTRQSISSTDSFNTQGDYKNLYKLDPFLFYFLSCSFPDSYPAPATVQPAVSGTGTALANSSSEVLFLKNALMVFSTLFKYYYSNISILREITQIPFHPKFQILLPTLLFFVPHQHLAQLTFYLFMYLCMYLFIYLVSAS